MAVRSEPPSTARIDRFLKSHAAVLTGVIVALFVVIHVVRLERILVNGDGVNYMYGALRVADGDFPHPRYSPGFAVLLAPLAVMLDGHPRLMLLTASAANIIISILSIVLLRRFLQPYLTDSASLVLVAIFALGQTATNVLVGTEVEPIALLLVLCALLALRSERAWLAVAATVAAGMCRVALVPFFGVLWLGRWQRAPRAAITAVASLGVSAITYLALGRRSSYLGVANQAYSGGDSAEQGLLEGLVRVVPDHMVRYARLGLPSALWPTQLLSTPPGYLLGATTTACTVVGAMVLLRRPPNDDGILRSAISAAASYVVLLWFWPANDGAVLRLSTPIAPVVLLLTFIGARHVARRLARQWAQEVLALGLALALVLALVTSAGLAVIVRTSSRPVADFVAATRRGAMMVPSGPVLSPLRALTEVATGRESVQYPPDSTPEQLQRLADRNNACMLVLSDIRDPAPHALEASLLRSGRAYELVSVGSTTVMTLDEPRCSLR